ncbi:hypothetical protein [Stagnihabitans tardus]|uniref:Uncharacterized protein n=1 Tax=Stagnihabitans tardus TaxID=2699202 RepID=A0AAE5BWP0_9RHOB|nr:hypothetical protein [Stagnihabitans tardus]NBZ89512.1 hypothetical protein [Stagnihabitans tardus]
MTFDRSQSKDPVSPRRKSSKRGHSAPADRLEQDDVGAAWLVAPFLPALLIFDGGTTFRSRKSLQVGSDLAASADD